MPKQKKIIHLLHHPPLSIHLSSTPEELFSKIKGHYISISEQPGWIGFWEDFHVKTAMAIKSQNSEFIQECWRPYSPKLHKEYSLEINGITHKVFPYKPIKFFGYINSLFSKEILEQLLEEQKKYEILLHIHDGHSLFIALLLTKIKGKNIPVVYQHRSNKFAIWHYKEQKGIKKLIFFSLLINYFQNKALKSVNVYLTDSKTERRYLLQILKYKAVRYFKQGIDPNEFNPDKYKKNVLRTKHGIPQEAKVILYVGRYYSDKDFDVLVHCFNQTKKTYPELVLLCVGGYKSDSFYSLAQQGGAMIFERIPQNQLTEFYSLADIYVMPTFNNTTTLFGGIGNAPIQAMAHNLRVVSNNLVHFPGNTNERKIIGTTIGDKQKLKTVLENELENLSKNNKSENEIRNLALKYYTLQKNIENLIKIYFELIK